jgi:hypothetical protein
MHWDVPYCISCKVGKYRRVGNARLIPHLSSDDVTHLDGYSQLVDGTTGARIRFDLTYCHRTPYMLTGINRAQVLDVSAGFFYSFVMTFFILLGLKALRLCFHGCKPLRRAQRGEIINDRYEALPQYRRNLDYRWD